jgi:hypothetical protein
VCSGIGGIEGEFKGRGLYKFNGKGNENQLGTEFSAHHRII